MTERRAPMADATADVLVADALDRLFTAERDVPADVNGATVNGHLARHVERALDERPDIVRDRWRVDYEYNRLGDDPKAPPRFEGMLASVAHELGWPADAFVGIATGRVVPGVIVRGSCMEGGNIIACELKRIGADARMIASEEQVRSLGAATVSNWVKCSGIGHTAAATPYCTDSSEGASFISGAAIAAAAEPAADRAPLSQFTSAGLDAPALPLPGMDDISAILADSRTGGAA
jgi:hypothetical protein